jgi:hypothetical protein
MWSMVYLIGVDHVQAQRRKRGGELTDCQREFQSVVESAILSINPELLAEEDHPDFLSGPDVPHEKVADSILLEISKAHGIEDRHRFVDPSQAERELIGYQELCGPDANEVPYRAHWIIRQFPKREKFWFGKLQNSLDKDILFVCGWGHIGSFNTLLARKGVTFFVWADKIGACSSDFTFYDAIRNYIKDHPEEFNNPNCPCLR